jgi:RNA polymerase sigma-70 factor (ECF subfamily)
MPERITEEQLRRVYGDTIDALYGYVSRRCNGERDLAEDVTQETWLRAVREWRRTGPPDNPLGWLTTVARNLILNHLRRRSPVPIDAVSAAEVLAAVDADAMNDSEEIASLVRQAMLRLPTAEAQLLETFHYDRLKVAQMAQVYGTTERAIEGRLRRARERLRRELEITLKVERRGGFV